MVAAFTNLLDTRNILSQDRNIVVLWRIDHAEILWLFILDCLTKFLNGS